MTCNSSAGAKQFDDSQTRLSSDCSSSSLIDHACSSFQREKLNVNVVDYDISDHMSLICEVKCFRNGNVLCYQKSVQDFSKFDVGVILKWS